MASGVQLESFLWLLFLATCIPAPVLSKDFYSFTVKDAFGHDVSLEEYRGKVSLVVNVASECGFTDSHYKALVKLQSIFGEKFQILAFPCNQFGGQEPKSAPEITEWAKENYEVNFPVLGKINVVDYNVPDAWNFLIDESGRTPTWNFWKYLVGPNGQVITAWSPHTTIEDIVHVVKDAVETITGVPTREDL